LILKVTRVALENASVAGMILTTECALIDIKEDNGGGPNGWRDARDDVILNHLNHKIRFIINETDFFIIYVLRQFLIKLLFF
jgi:hypothetical protein